MNPYRNWIEPAGQSLSGHLERLRVTLTGLGGQMREAVASAVSRAASEALRQALATLLRQPGEGQDTLDDRRPFDDRPRLGDPSRRGIPLRSDWGEPERLDGWHEPGESRWDRRDGTDWRSQRDDDHDEYGERGENDDQDQDDDPDRAEQQHPASGWRSVLAAGCHLAAWLLGRLARPGRALAALGVGLATGLAVWLAGPDAGPGPLAALTDAVATGADALARLGTR
jgi:hypothetical protein